MIKNDLNKASILDMSWLQAKTLHTVRPWKVVDGVSEASPGALVSPYKDVLAPAAASHTRHVGVDP